ncbi:RNA-directed DNA polymerase, eukaryota [Tanacetum coccineum]
MDVVINEKRKIIIHGIVLDSGVSHHVLNSVHDEAPQSKAAEALPNEETPVSEDPFGIYGLLHKNNDNNSGSMESVDPKFPHGFTPSTSDQEKPKEDHVQVSSNCAYTSSSRTRESKKNRGMTSFPNSHSGEIARWINGLCHKHRINFMSLQETKKEGYRRLYYQGGLGQMYFDHVVGPVGWYFSGGIASRHFYLCPQELSEKRDLWNYLQSFISRWDGETVLIGDFNEVNTEESAVKPEPELKNTIECNLNPSDGPGKPNSIFMKTVKTKWALNQLQQPICVHLTKTVKTLKAQS